MKKNIRNNFIDTILEQIISQSLFSPNDRWLLAVSGGPDSMAMLHGLLILQRETEWPGPEYFHVAHLNHQHRGAESNADAELVRNEAKKLGLDCTVGSTDVDNIAMEIGESLETTARTERYKFLAQTAIQNHCNKIALAHNADDQAETILHRILRGTGIRGLAGIPSRRKLEEYGPTDKPLFAIRPLLTIRKMDIEEFIKTETIPCRIDQTNLSSDHTRNRLRNELLPLLKEKYNPQVLQALNRLGQTAEWMTELLHEDAKSALSELTVSRTKNSLCLDLPGLQNQSVIQQTELIHLAMRELSVHLRPIGFQHINSILQLIAADDTSGQSIHLPNQFVLIRKSTQLILTIQKPVKSSILESPPAKITLPINQRISLDVPMYGTSPEGISRINRILTEQQNYNPSSFQTFLQHKSNYQEIIDFDKLYPPLIFRTWRRGDRFEPLGVGGEKTLGDFFTDAKVPVEYRKRIGVVCDEVGVVWVTGLRIAERVKITPQTRQILKLTVE